jgi:hypothetical protein
MMETNTMVGTGMKVVCQRDELSQKGAEPGLPLAPPNRQVRTLQRRPLRRLDT